MSAAGQQIYGAGSAGAHSDLGLRILTLQTVNRTLKNLDARIEGSLTDGTLERTIDGASTLSLTLHDPKRVLLRSGVFSKQADVVLDDYPWRLVKVTKSGDDLTLVFEDRAVALLRGPRRPKKASRANVTRAQFALSLIREVRPLIPYNIPELTQRQPVAGVSDKRANARALPYQYRRGTTDGKWETSWTCLQRLAEEVNWRCFCANGTVWFVSEDWLRKQTPKLDITEDTLGVDAIDFDIDNGKVNSQATVTARVARWGALPGSAVKVSNCGPANGIWLVASVSRGVFDAAATITLKRPTEKLEEPAPETQAVSSTSTGGTTAAIATLASGANSGASSAVNAVYSAAVAMNARRFPYVWGGGHGAAGVPSGNPPGYDCSGSTVALLAAGRLGFRPGGGTAVSGTLASWGAPGRGQFLTIYANAIHVFVVFHTAKGDQHFGTGRWGKSWSGAGFNPSMHPTGGFAARHWPGT